MKYMELTNDPQYAQLKKNLANVVAAQVKAYGKEGLATDAGKALTAQSTGTDTMPLDVLLNTAYRSLGDIKSSELEAKALSKFTKKFGTNNIGVFQKAWGENADTDVLQLKAMQDMGADKKDIEELPDWIKQELQDIHDFNIFKRVIIRNERNFDDHS